MDNLLIINNISENISFFYDTKKSNPIQTVGSPQSILVYKTKPAAVSNPIQVQEPPKTTQEEPAEGTELNSVDTTTEAATTELSNTSTKEETKAADFPAFSTENAICNRKFPLFKN